MPTCNELTRRPSLAALICYLASLGLTFAAGGPRAEDGDISPLRLSGYGTLAKTWDNRDYLAPIRDFSQRPEDGHVSGPSWRLDSRVALQAAYRLSPQLSALAQVVVRDQVATGLGSAVELAHLEFAPQPTWKFRIGRLGYNAFLMSDHRNLGYAYAWVRPPREFYSWIPMFSVDGVDVTHDFALGDAHWRIRGQWGKSGFDIPMGDEVFEFKARRVWSVTASRIEDPWRLKVGLSGFTSSREAEPLSIFHQGLEQLSALGLPGISAEAAWLRQETSFKNARIGYLTFGAAYDDGIWIGQAEFGRSLGENTITPSSRTGYVAMGRRIGDLTPYAMLSASRPAKTADGATADWSPVGQAGFQATAFRTLNSTRQDQDTLTLGVRWDINSRVALKAQFEHSRIKPFGYVLWFRSTESNYRDSSVNVTTVALDFVF